MEADILPFLAEQRSDKNKDKLSFNDIIEELKMIKLCIITVDNTDIKEVRITKLTEKQKQILSLLSINENVLNFS